MLGLAILTSRQVREWFMKILIASDLHGSIYYVDKLIERIKVENPDRIILLGDILYHGPRNDLPSEYSPKSVISALAPYSDKIIAVRGNCDAEVDLMVLPFEVKSRYVFGIGGRKVYATHGHHFNPSAMPKCLKEGDILLTGHTHVVANCDVDGVRYLNPGSISIPKQGTPRGYIVVEEGAFVFRDLDGVEYDRYIYKNHANC